MTWDVRTLFDAVEYAGIWWSPEHFRERVAGTASFDPEEGISLQTIGAFAWASADTASRPIRSPLLLGLTGSVPTAVTLYRTTKVGLVDANPQPATSTFGARCMVVGHHFYDPEGVLFSAVSASFTDLEEWVGHHPFAGTIPGTHTRHRPPDDVAVDVSSLGARITVGSSVSNKSDGLRFMHWNHVARLTVEPEEPKPLEWYEDILRGFQDLLTLLVGRPAYLRAVKGKPPGHTAEPDLYFHQELRSLKDRSLTSMHGLSREGDVLVALRRISPGLSTVLGNWFDKRDRLGPVYDLFFGSLFSPRTQPEFQFLSLVQALEAYHGRTSPGRDWRLRDRLQGLLDALPTSGIVEDRPNLVQKVVYTRNYLTHYSENLANRVLRGTDLLEVTDDLRRLLAFFLFDELGLDTGTVLAAIEKIPRYIYFSPEDS